MSVTEQNDLKDFKVQIKAWELEFSRTNSKKPSKEDIHSAPDNIKEAYRNYWKLKKKIDIEKDDVWNSSLNKSIQTNRKLKDSSSLKRFCDRLKQQTSNGNFKNDNPMQRNKLGEPSKKRHFADDSLMKILHGPGVGDNTSITNSIDTSITSDDHQQFSESECNIKFQMTKTHVDFIKSDDVFRKVSSVNMLSPIINLTDPVKKLHFKKDLNEDWLKRCDENILKDSKEILDAESTKNFIRDNDNNTESTSSCVDTTRNIPFVDCDTGQTESCSPSKINENGIHLKHTKQGNKLSECDLENAPYKFTSSDVKNDLKNVPNDHNLPDETSLCTDKNIYKNQSGSNLEDKQVPDIELQSLKVKQLSEDNVQETKKANKRKLSRLTQCPDPVTSKKANHLKRKMAAGTLNENYVSLNIKKKKFSRGHRPVNVRKIKWNKWKQMKKSSGVGMKSSNITSCFKCGELGHWARQCNVSTIKKENDTLLAEEDVDDIPLPTLEEAAKLAEEEKQGAFSRYESSKRFFSKQVKSNIAKDLEDKEDHIDASDINSLNELPQFDETDYPKAAMKPLYETSENGKPVATPKAVFAALSEMGHSDFRQGQENAIMRVLSGLSTLVVLPTGSGKSLCYQLPAYMYAKHSKSLAIVVSPLVSLMEDQVTGLPSCLHAVCLHSGMTDIQKANAVKDISDGLAQILLVSPEAIIGGHNFSDTILNSTMPPISFVCIDEVHCISQWSHNFRPSYLQLYKVLTHKMGVKCILGLTATATQSTIDDIVSHLDLKCVDDSVVGRTNVPRNLLLSISRDKDKDKALIQLLNGDRFCNCSSIIIYCIRRAETERLAALIRTCMQDEIEPEADPMSKKKKTKSKKRNFAWTAEAYHAGLAPPRRRSIQKKFMSGKLRIVIATVAFGMGLDKRDVRAIIHYNMPKNFESYVQEIGRAGRDGLDSHCHLFLDSERNDLWELQRHIYSNSIDRHTLRKLLKRVFVPCKCSVDSRRDDNLENMEIDCDSNQNVLCPKHEIAFTINETVQELDVKQENISTLLCYMELHSKHWIEILSPAYATCTIRCYGGPKQMHGIALKNPAIATAIGLAAENGKQWEKSSNFSFPVIQVASAIGWNSAVLKRDLKRLEWNDMKRKTGVIVEFSDLSFHVSAPGNLSGEELDTVLDFLHNKVVSSEETELKNLKLLFSVFQRYSSNRYWDCCDEVNMEFSDGIKSAINKYFERSDLLSDEIEEITEKHLCETTNEVDVSYVRSLIKDIICTHHDQNFTGRAIARIFHGISSPCFPPEVWGRVRKFWRCLLPVNFNTILKMANEELRSLK